MTNKALVDFLMRVAHHATDSFFKQSVKEYADRKYRMSMQSIKKALQYNNYKNEFHARCINANYDVEEFLLDNMDFDESVTRQELLCMASIELSYGKLSFQEALDKEALDMDLVTDSLDYFNNAGKIAHSGGDFEMEAIAEMNLGKVLFKGLKKLEKARIHLYNSLKLANLIDYKNVASELWHKVATKLMQEVRD